ncbi:uncharacterized protein TRAVEDRAFT_29839 [Trametes versicolor FP-101664 SS1]|uniref:uncharacterized protein n=1 Tax=Trametes versicolor (strain FP-101664) TaxID=717944 RepID=UPI0004621E47|nr:uncharacterized protein TRAVEDRAFT_29839 [Trametes versicolor FP-101664 SS1]EIW57963.1 hypothetical protein TRAVEDRAFT_29839 [Trametes versicolor FP-101664 SS1]
MDPDPPLPRLSLPRAGRIALPSSTRGSLRPDLARCGHRHPKPPCPSMSSSVSQILGAFSLTISTTSSDADLEQDPLFNILCDQGISHAPQCYRLKLIDMDPSSDDDTALESFFSFTASPVQSPSFAATSFPTVRQPHRPAPLSLPLPSPSYLSPVSPNVVIRGGGDKVDRWIHSGGLDQPMMTPMLVEDSPHEEWDDGGQSDWREIIDHFLQHEQEHDHEHEYDHEEREVGESWHPLTPVGRAGHVHSGRANFLIC